MATALLAMRDGQIPPTINLESRPTGVTSTSSPEGAQGDVNTVLINARGFGGFNSALVMRRIS